MIRKHRLMATILLSILTAAIVPSTTFMTMPIIIKPAAATHGADVEVVEGETVTFTWTCFTEPEPKTVNCKMIDGPPGATFTEKTGLSPQTGTFTWENAGPPGNYTATFRTSCLDCEEPTPPFDGTVTIEILPANQPPTANAGADKTVNEGATVKLVGTGSSDPDGTIASYSWTQTAGTLVKLSSTSSPTPTFTAPDVDSAGSTLTFALKVTDNDGATSTADSVNVKVNNVVANQPPTANAGADKTVNEGATVKLVGSASTDPDGTIVSYSWTQISGTSVTLNGASSPTPSFTAPNVGPKGETLIFKLTVTDNDKATDTDFVSVIVNDVKGGGGGNGNPPGTNPPGTNGNPQSGNPPGTNPPGGGSASAVRYPYHFTITQTGTAELAKNVGIFPAGTYNLRVEISGDTRYEGSHPQKIVEDSKDVAFKKGSVKGTLVIDQVDGNNDVRVRLDNIELLWLTNENGQIDTIGDKAIFSIPYAKDSADGTLHGHIDFGQEIKWGKNYVAIDSNIPLTIKFSGGPNPGTAILNDDPDSATGQLKFGRP